MKSIKKSQSTTAENSAKEQQVEKMIDNITNEISEAMDQVIGTDDEVSILNDMFKVYWEEQENPYVIFPKGSNNYYVFSIRSNGWSNWSNEIAIDVDTWNELAEEAQEGIASGLAETTFMVFGDRIMNSKKLVGTFEDDDFGNESGEVEVFWYENSNTIKACDLIIYDVPKEKFYGEVLNGTFSEKFEKAWNFYTSVFHTYGVVRLSYDQLEDEQLNELRNQFVEG